MEESEKERARRTYNIHIYAYKLQIGYKNKKKECNKIALVDHIYTAISEVQRQQKCTVIIAKENGRKIKSR